MVMHGRSRGHLFARVCRFSSCFIPNQDHGLWIPYSGPSGISGQEPLAAKGIFLSSRSCSSQECHGDTVSRLAHTIQGYLPRTITITFVHPKSLYGRTKAGHQNSSISIQLYILRLPHHVIIIYIFTLFSFATRSWSVRRARRCLDFCSLLLFISKPASKDTRNDHIFYF